VGGYPHPVAHRTDETYVMDAGDTWNPRATMRPTIADPTEEPSAGDLGHAMDDALELRGKLGEGGMGVVHLAVQRSLDREVAVKTLRRESTVAAQRLLREAWVTGALEHPNIVPVYDLGRDEEGRPHLVLKRIEGALWSELIEAPEGLRERFGVLDPLDWHLRILAQLCNAVAFAHDRGVIHRDLKPDNVMVGGYGEVYLLDWGLAMAIHETLERLPTVGQPKRFAGTPAYLAPEQLSDSEHPLGTHTDVYLLGGMLYEVLHGRPPHGGTTLDEVLAGANHAPEVSQHVPAPLAELLGRCLAPDPAERPATAQAVRRDLLAYLQERHAHTLAQQAQQQLDELLEALRIEGDDDAVAARVRDLLGACRFGFGQALEIDPDNTLARQGLALALSAVARQALERGELGAARLLLDELDDSPADLVQALSNARREREELEARRRALERDLDPTVGVRWRMMSLLAVSTSWSVAPIVAFWPLGQPISYRQLWVECVLLGVVALGVLVAGRTQLRRTSVSRVLAGVTVLAPASQAVLVALGVVMGVEAGQALALSLAGWAVMSWMGTILYGPRILPIPASYITAAFLAASMPAWGPAWMVAANLAFTVTMVLYRLPALREAQRKWAARQGA